MEIVGKIIQVLPLQEGVGKSSGQPWKIQSYVLETQEQYPKKVCFELFGEERINNNRCQLDDIVTVSFDIDSHEYNGKWYTRIRAWRVQQGIVTNNDQPMAQPVAQTTQTAQTVQQQPATTMGGNTTPFDAAADDENTDLPF